MELFPKLCPMVVSLASLFFPCGVSAGSVFPGPIQESAKEVLDYWTSARMKAAESGLVGLPPTNPEATPITVGGDSHGDVSMPAPYGHGRLSRLVGMLFYVGDSGEPVHCSASVIDSSSGSVILTAAHCLRHAIGTGGWHTHMMFVPAYNGVADTERERAPFGRWVVRQSFIPDANAGAAADRDVGVARLYRSLDLGDTVQVRLDDALYAMSQSATFDTRIRSVGYPSDRIGHGLGRQFYCDSYAHTVVSAGELRTPNCGFGDGHSGGPAILDPEGQGDGPPGAARQVIGVLHTTRFTQLSPDNFDELYLSAESLED